MQGLKLIYIYIFFFFWGGGGVKNEDGLSWKIFLISGLDSFQLSCNGNPCFFWGFLGVGGKSCE